MIRVRALAILLGAGMMGGGAALATVASDASDAAVDSARVHVTTLDDLVVSGEAAVSRPTERVVISAEEVAVRDPVSLADVGALLPSTRVAVNSRGESTLMIRGAPERHVQAFLDGIPLNLPWDERVDLGAVPVTGLMRLEGRRGLASLLEGPGALAGSVRLLAPEYGGAPGSRTSASLGEGGSTRLDMSGGAERGEWLLLGSGGWHNRDSVPLPGGDDRQNSDLDRYSLLLRASRPVGDLGRLNLLATGWHEKKGVPPELHLGEDARFWRYPRRERGLLGASLHLPVGHDGDWDLSAMAAADYFEQEIDPRGPDGWGGALLSGQDYEHDFDRTAHAMLGVTRWLGDRARVTLQGNARYAHHRESLTVGGGVLAYAQWLTAVVLETEVRPDDRWTVRAGVGIDRAATPQTGDKPDRAADSAEALNLRLERHFDRGTTVYASASRRSRFPGLRELFSGALGKFVPNPELEPERQDLLEVGAKVRRGRWDLTCAAFLQDLRGGIEKQKIPGTDGLFQRVNLTDIRVPGIEAVLAWRPEPDLALTAQHTVLAARAETDDGFTAPTEDRPDYLSLAAVRWSPPQGPNALLETGLTGPRWSADASGASDATGGLKRLPAGAIWGLRLGYRWVQDGRTVECHLRAANLFDQWVDGQVGLPLPGRVFSGGIALGL